MTTVVVVASGPSLTLEQCALVEERRAAGRVRVVVVNRSWELLPRADALYAADGRWWDRYWPHVERGFVGACWTQDRDAAARYELCHVECKTAPGLSRDPAIVHSGSNGGYQALNLTRHFLFREPTDDEKRILLLGYDLSHHGGRRHWHEDYPAPFGNAGSVQSWIEYYDRLAADLRDDGIAVTNCSATTALTCFPRADLRTVLEAL